MSREVILKYIITQMREGEEGEGKKKGRERRAHNGKNERNKVNTNMLLEILDIKFHLKLLYGYDIFVCLSRYLCVC